MEVRFRIKMMMIKNWMRTRIIVKFMTKPRRFLSEFLILL